MKYLVICILGICIICVTGCSSSTVMKSDVHSFPSDSTRTHSEVQQPLDTIMHIYLWGSVLLIVSAALTK